MWHNSFAKFYLQRLKKEREHSQHANTLRLRISHLHESHICMVPQITLGFIHSYGSNLDFEELD